MSNDEQHDYISDCDLEIMEGLKFFRKKFEDYSIYLSCKGNLILGCDWSYESQDNMPELTLCHITEFKQFYEKNIKDLISV